MGEATIERVYQFLNSIGYFHPIHPPATHIPIGLVFGALLLGVLSLIFRHQAMARAARYSTVISFIFLLPVALLGYMDWQHQFAGGWLLPIKVKIVLAVFLFFFLSAALIVGRKSDALSGTLLIFYSLSFLAAIGLGFFGGQIVYSGKTPAGPPELRAGERLFRSNCSGCHAYGGNIVDPSSPLWNSDELKDSEILLRFIRDPKTDAGKRGIMPPFLPSRVSDAQAKQLWLYLAGVMETGKKPEEGELLIPQFQVKTDLASIEKGNKLFQANCTGCHRLDSTETLVGPGLKGILKRRTLPASGREAIPANIYRQLRLPYAEMPTFAKSLTDDQVFDLIAFLNTR
jgi:mono/diheme cytochrome c family protein